MTFQDTSDSRDTFKEQQIWNYAGKISRSSLPVHPLHQLPAATPIGYSQRTTIHRCPNRITVPVGTTGSMEISTILLSFALPKWVFNCDAIGIIHIPLAMWSDKEHTRTSRSLDDDRVADLQIGDSEVRSAIYYHLVARWRAFQMEMDPSSSPLFGQILLRQFATLMAERLRYFVFEVPTEHWPVNVRNLPQIPTPMWDLKAYKEHQHCYKGPLGQLYCSFDGNLVALVFMVKPEQPDSPPILWTTTVSPLVLNRDVEHVRSEVIANIFLEADPPIQLRYPQGVHLGPPGLTGSPLPISYT